MSRELGGKDPPVPGGWPTGPLGSGSVHIFSLSSCLLPTYSSKRLPAFSKYFFFCFHYISFGFIVILRNLPWYLLLAKPFLPTFLFSCYLWCPPSSCPFFPSQKNKISGTLHPLYTLFRVWARAPAAQKLYRVEHQPQKRWGLVCTHCCMLGNQSKAWHIISAQ